MLQDLFARPPSPNNKRCQYVATESNIILIGAPNSVGEEIIKEVFQKELKEMEKGQGYNGRWELDFEVVREFPPGMPWESKEEKKKIAGNNFARMAFVIHVPRDHSERMKGLLREAKSRKTWAKYWGKQPSP